MQHPAGWGAVERRPQFALGSQPCLVAPEPWVPRKGHQATAPCGRWVKRQCGCPQKNRLWEPSEPVGAVMWAAGPSPTPFLHGWRSSLLGVSNKAEHGIFPGQLALRPAAAPRRSPGPGAGCSSPVTWAWCRASCTSGLINHFFCLVAMEEMDTLGTTPPCWVPGVLGRQSGVFVSVGSGVRNTGGL